MPKKLTQAFVEKTFSDRGYKVLSVYKGCSVPIEFECPNGHIYHIMWSSFKGGAGCLLCSRSAKPTIERIREEFSKVGYCLVSDVYVDNHTKLDFICDVGHEHSITWNAFNSGNRCGVCFIKRKHDTEVVKDGFAKAGFTLFTTCYQDNKQKLSVMCPKKHRISITWNDFQQGIRCRDCSKFRKKDVGFYEEFISNFGYKLLGVEGDTSEKTKLLVSCPEGHEYWVSWQGFQRGDRCRKCFAISRKKSFVEIKAAFAEEGYIVTSSYYENANSKLKVLCPKGHSVSITWAHFYDGNRCSTCSKSGVSIKSQSWLDGLGVPDIYKVTREVKLDIPYAGKSFMRVDGFDPETNTVYEFLGDYWHGNPNVFDQDAVHPYGKTYGRLFDETMEKLFALRRNGYSLVVMWEEDFI